MNPKHTFPLLALALAVSSPLSAEEPAFESELFEAGTLVYSDDFDGELNRERWSTKGTEVEDGQLVVSQQFKNAEEAMEKLNRDHHLGLEPVTHLNKIPERFVCHLRYQFKKPGLTPGRPSFQIGHHMISLGIAAEGGHRVRLPNGTIFIEEDSAMALNEWIDLIIEYKKGTLVISVNGDSATYEDEGVTIINEKDKHGPRFTFKGGEGCRILFDSVSLWDCTE
jgi:hypothetical protein